MQADTLKHEYILITSQNFPSGGAGASYLNLFCRGMKLNGLSIKVLLLKGFAFGNLKKNDRRKNITDYGVPFTYLGMINRPRNKVLKFFDDFLCAVHLTIVLLLMLSRRRNKCLLVYNNELQSNLIIYLLARLVCLRIVTFVPEYYDKNDFKDSIFRRIKWYGFLIVFNKVNRLSDKLIVFTSFLKDHYINQGIPESKILIQPNLTDFEYWEPVSYNLKYTLGYSGAPYLKDGLLDLFNAISILHKEGIQISLMVIGDSTFGKSLLPNLKIQCEKLNISDNVFFSGLVETSLVKQYLSECRILAITRPLTVQTKAGFPTKLGEYFASKKPVLATNFGDIERYFLDGTDIIIADSGDPESIAKKIKWMLQNPEALDKITWSGYCKAKELLDFQESIKKVIRFINE